MRIVDTQVFRKKQSSVILLALDTELGFPELSARFYYK